MAHKLSNRSRPTDAKDFIAARMIGWLLTTPMRQLVVIIGPDVFSAAQEGAWIRTQRLAPKTGHA